MINIIKRCIEPLRILADNVEEEAVINILNAKLANLVALAGIRFRQFDEGADRVVSYYGVNFMGSGEKKDFTIDCINDFLLPFIRTTIEKRVEDYKEDFYYRYVELEDNKRKKEANLKLYDSFRVPQFELEKINSTGFYREAVQASTVQLNALFVRLDEFGDYLENVTNGNASKKEFWQGLKTNYEGKITPPIIAGDPGRKPVLDMAIQLLAYSDFGNLYQDKVKKDYLRSLKTGHSRRTFFYMNNKKTNRISYPVRPSEKNAQIAKLRSVSRDLENIFNALLNKDNKIYLFDEQANEAIYQYQCRCIDYFNDNPQVDIVIRNEIKESFWKIQKLSVVYCAVDQPQANVVTEEYVEQAIEFYLSVRDGLTNVLTERELDLTEKYAKYLYDNRNQIVKMSDLRKLNYIYNANFARTFNGLIDDIREELSEQYGVELIVTNGARNSKYFTVKEDDGSMEEL